MPAGDLLAVNGQVEVRATLLGRDTVYKFRRWPSFFARTTKSADTDYAHADGVFAADDFAAARSVPILLAVEHATPAALQGYLDTFLALWALGDSEEIHWRDLAGVHRYVVGRTRNIEIDETHRNIGRIEIDAELFIPDPTITVVP